jgi:hypothetical protein
VEVLVQMVLVSLVLLALVVVEVVVTLLLQIQEEAVLL